MPRAELVLELDPPGPVTRAMHLEGGAPLSLARVWLSTLRGLELAEKLVHGQSLIFCRLNDRVHLEIPHRAVKCVEQLEGLLVLCVVKGISRSIRTDFVQID